MARIDVGDLTALDLLKQPYAGRPTCANGHPWKPETTRWRRRGYRGEHTTEIERDCLVCKRVSEGKRRERLRISERNYR